MRTRHRIALVATILLTLSACSATDQTAETPPDRADSAGASAGADGPPPTAEERAEAEEVAVRFLDAANAGDEEAVAEVFAEDARFDSVGRIYPSRADIMDRFLVPEVLDVGGSYEVVETRWEGDRHVVHYDFETGRGGRESFTYAYLVRDGLIQDVVGRYL
ncbi:MULTISPECIES: nuclear transport factor 2 family protein [Actinoalloteichus]|uniref:SnoaL-like domain n=1 Tax=Actinoalloteichus fjordicus TaxID=1612552 RepID=A0AAC9LB07_9PSEU|nr:MULTISPECIES: nuclear transport factor 2 family protein [Actinoalloteichus]APU13575.1 SnoaL-like domain [Actinoalloteichus fjordicus]APU19522.1 SnoaL-like domain [Actinoalloteichus sp. GBA129-24]